MNEQWFGIFKVYTIMLTISVVLFYFGGVKGKAKNPEFNALLFGMFWFITIPLLAWNVVKAFQEDKKGR